MLFSQIIKLLFSRNILSYDNGYNYFKSFQIGFFTSAVSLPLTPLNAELHSLYSSHDCTRITT